MREEDNGRPVSGVRCPVSRGAFLRWLLLVLLPSIGLELCLATEPAPVPPGTGHQAPDTRPVSIDLSASPAAVNVGDPVTITLTYRWPHGWVPTTPSHEPDPSAAFAGEFVTSLPPVQRISTGEEERRTFVLTCSALRSGAWALPRPTLAVDGPRGRVEATASAVIVQVGTEAKPAQLPPPRPAWARPRAAGAAATPAWVYGAVAVAIAGLATWLLLLRRRAAPPPPTPREVFARDWQAAADSGDGKEAGARLSLALRRYAGAIYRFDGPGSTTRETAFHLRGRMPEGEQRELVRQLDQLDALRWAADDLEVTAVRPSLDAALAWVEAVQRRLDVEAAAESLAKSAPTATAAAGGGPR
jgi:hypothetical protein